jgi:hypothetical protein
MSYAGSVFGDIKGGHKDRTASTERGSAHSRKAE